MTTDEISFRKKEIMTDEISFRTIIAVKPSSQMLQQTDFSPFSTSSRILIKFYCISPKKIKMSINDNQNHFFAASLSALFA